MEKSLAITMWVRSWNCGCLVTWFCYQMIAKPGNKTGTVSWPDPCVHESISQYSHTALDRHILSSVFQYIKIILACRWKPIQNFVISFKRYAHSDLYYLYLLDKCGSKSSKTLGLYLLSGKMSFRQNLYQKQVSKLRGGLFKWSYQDLAGRCPSI